jgi:O-antigen/teichoic acid export membrane protein
LSAEAWAPLLKAVLVLADQAVVSGANFATTLIIGRLCLPEELGFYALGMSVVFGLLGVPRSLVWTPYTNFRPRLPSRRASAYTASALVHTLLIAAIASLGSAALGLSLYLFAPAFPLSVLFLVLAPVAGLMMLREYARQMCLASLQLGAVISLDVATAVVQAGGLILLARAGALSATRAYLVVAMACLTSFVIWWLHARPEPRVSPRRIWAHFAHNWRLSKWVLPAAVAVSVGEALYPWLLALLHDSAAVGVLSASLSVILLTNPLLIGVSNFCGPTIARAFAKGGTHRLWRATLLAMLAFSAVMMMFLGAVALWGRPLIEFLYGPAYAGQDQVVFSLALPLPIKAAVIPLGFALLATGRGDVTLKGSLVYLACTATIGAWCINRFGPAGVGYGSFVAALSVFVVQVSAFVYTVQAQVTAAGEPSPALATN